MRKKYAVIYVPGLGDHRSQGQRLAVKLWKLYGVDPEVVTMRWRDREAYNIKLARLLDRVETLTETGYLVSLVGTSAGASAVVNAFAARPELIHRVVCICGKLKNPQTVHPATYARNPGFQESMERLTRSLTQLSTEQRNRVLSIHPVADESVPPHDTEMPDSVSRRIPTIGHAPSIAYAITLYAHVLLRFIKQD